MMLQHMVSVTPSGCCVMPELAVPAFVALWCCGAHGKMPALAERQQPPCWCSAAEREAAE